VHEPILPERFIFFDDSLTEPEPLVMPEDAPSASAARVARGDHGLRRRAAAKMDNDFA
jgi:hypothetical protein